MIHCIQFNKDNLSTIQSIKFEQLSDHSFGFYLSLDDYSPICLDRVYWRMVGELGDKLLSISFLNGLLCEIELLVYDANQIIKTDLNYSHYEELFDDKIPLFFTYPFDDNISSIIRRNIIDNNCNFYIEVYNDALRFFWSQKNTSCYKLSNFCCIELDGTKMTGIIIKLENISYIKNLLFEI